MATHQLQLAEFMDAFSGNAHNYGVHKYAFGKKAGEKEAGANSTVTSRLLTAEQYKAHLSGEMGLGVIPINEAGDCKFGVIDLDVYDDALAPYVAALERNNFPLVPFRSKSGGLHLYLFMKQFVNAKAVVDLLQDMSALLGLDIYVRRRLNRMIEVFPKQLRATDGGVGNWINLPYYDAEKTRQPAVVGGKDLSLGDALAVMKERRRSLNDVRRFLSDMTLKDGPPCLQTIGLLNQTGPESGRNNYLFSLGVYLKKKDPDFWEQRLSEANAAMLAPLPKGELESTVINSLRKKDYAYRCLEAPCVDFCRRPLCKTREFGIGKEGGYFSELEFGKLVQIKANEPYYEWEVKTQSDEKFTTLRFKSEADIIGQDAFLRLCFRELRMLPVKVKQAVWFSLINQALSEVEVREVEREDDTSPIGLFRALFLEFLLDRAPAKTREQILTKRAFFDDKAARYFFRAQDLSEYVFVTKSFRYYMPGELHGILRDAGASPVRLKTEAGRQIRVYEISAANVRKLGETTDAPFKAEFKKEGEGF